MPLLSVFMMLGMLEAFFRLKSLLPQQDWFTRQSLLEESDFPLFNQICDDETRATPHRNQEYEGIPFAYRDLYYSPEKPEDVFRIVGTGDSFAWGWGIFNSVYTSFKMLECWFSLENRQPRIEVINFSRPGWGTHDQEEFLAAHAFDFQPDLVLLQYNLNDATSFHGMMPFGAMAETIAEEKANPLHRISKLYEFIDIRLTESRVRRWTRRTYHDSYLGKNSMDWQETQISLLNMAAACRQRNVTFVVSIFPLLYGLEKSKYEFAAEVNEIERFLNENGIICHNMLPDFMGRESSSLWSLPHDAHPNARGQHIAAQSTWRFLTANKLIPEPAAGPDR